MDVAVGCRHLCHHLGPLWVKMSDGEPGGEGGRAVAASRTDLWSAFVGSESSFSAMAWSRASGKRDSGSNSEDSVLSLILIACPALNEARERRVVCLQTLIQRGHLLVHTPLAFHKNRRLMVRGVGVPGPGPVP